jgi:hypothetical protein
MAGPPRFAELFRECEGTAVHLEMRDAYRRSDPAFVDWKAGIPVNPVTHWAEWFGIVREATRRGVEVRRARIVSTPVSEYIRFEYAVTADLNVAAGEEVRWLSRRRATDLQLPGNDFWVFDSRVVLVNHFDGEADDMNVEFAHDPVLVKLCSSAFESVWDRATPHADFDLA